MIHSFKNRSSLTFSLFIFSYLIRNIIIRKMEENINEKKIDELENFTQGLQKKLPIFA